MGNYQSLEDKVSHPAAKSFFKEVYEIYKTNSPRQPNESQNEIKGVPGDQDEQDVNNNNNNSNSEEPKSKKKLAVKFFHFPKKFGKNKKIKEDNSNIDIPPPPKKDLIECLIECLSPQNTRATTFNIILEGLELESTLFSAFCTVLAKVDSKVGMLKLIKCNLTSNDIKSLSNAIQTNRSLRYLDLSENQLSVDDIQILESGLSLNYSIQNLILSSVNFSDACLTALSPYLRTRKLKVVDLSENNITEVGYDEITSILASNVFLTDFRVRENEGIDNEKTKKIGQQLIRNESVVGVIQMILEKTFIARNIKLRATQTEMSRFVQPEMEEEEPKSRSRGRTVNANLSQIVASKEVDYGNTPSKRYKYGLAGTKGRRKTMEDATLMLGSFNDRDDLDIFCVFDGHGSSDSSIYVATHIPQILKKNLELTNYDIPTTLRTSFIEINKELSSFAMLHGTTAVVAAILGDVLYVANVGDSRAVLCRDGVAHRLTVDHHPSLEGEKERIEASGGSITNGRVNGCLAVTRALGDAFAGEAISAEPYLVSVHLNSSDTFLILACDGLFEKFTDEGAVDYAKKYYNDPKEASEKLKNQAFAAGSNDNISVAVVNFGQTHSSIAPEASHSVNVIYGLYKKNNDNGHIEDLHKDNDQKNVIITEVTELNDESIEIKQNTKKNNDDDDDSSEGVYDCDDDADDDDD